MAVWDLLNSVSYYNNKADGEEWRETQLRSMPFAIYLQENYWWRWLHVVKIFLPEFVYFRCGFCTAKKFLQYLWMIKELYLVLRGADTVALDD